MKTFVLKKTKPNKKQIKIPNQNKQNPKDYKGNGERKRMEIFFLPWLRVDPEEDLKLKKFLEEIDKTPLSI